jgi:hypothetical protein
MPPDLISPEIRELENPARVLSPTAFLSASLRRRHLAPLIAALANPALARAQEAGPTAIPGTTQYGLESRGGQPFRLFLHIPAGPPSRGQPNMGWNHVAASPSGCSSTFLRVSHRRAAGR